ncbi:WASH complex subunit 3-like [Harpegnathos saltator]|uniref:WASH complex subunit 3-like n=1 Tax=Harpegnathos saltator TaxID=610380 RepID=UPI000DBEE762|nr:WASH complex subunit 3-like [Harpegnathos saltator]
MDSRIQDAADNAPLKRDQDSVDDFEHLGHDSGSLSDERTEQHPQQHLPPRLIDPPRVDDLLHIGDSFQASDNVLPSALLVDGNVDAKPVPATPPPSADFEKCEAMAQSSDPFQRPLDPVDPKLATMAFVETERTSAHQLLRDEHADDDEVQLESPPPPPPPPLSLLPTSFTAAAEPAASLSDGDAAKQANYELGFEEHSNAVADQGKSQHEQREAVPVSGANDFGEDLVRDVRSSVLPAPERSPLLDFLGDDERAPSQQQDKVKNIMDDDSWNVVEEADVKREQLKEPEPPTKPLPPLPKEAELLETAHRDKYEMSNDFLLEEAAKDKPPPPPPPHSVVARSEPENNTKRRETSKSKEPDYVCSRPPVSKTKKDEIEIAPKEIFRDIGLDAWFNPERLNPRGKRTSEEIFFPFSV